jgi:hypothetical protein
MFEQGGGEIVRGWSCSKNRLIFLFIDLKFRVATTKQFLKKALI